MPEKQNTLTIGLFGTCGSSAWRESFIKYYSENSIQFFDPIVEDWDPSCAAIESWHLAHDEILIFPITKETYGQGSLSESGFSIIQAMKFCDRRDIIIMIEQELDPKLMPSDVEKALLNDLESKGISNLINLDILHYRMMKEKADRAKDSLRSRALVKEHLSLLRLDTVFVVDTLQEALNVSLKCYAARNILKNIRNIFNPQNKI